MVNGDVRRCRVSFNPRGNSLCQPYSADGEFDLENNAGVHGLPAGDYEVVVVQLVLTDHLAASEHSHGKTVPRRYADYYTSGLKVSLAENHQPPIKIELEDK